MTEEEIKKKAYLEGMRLRRSGIDDDVIYARLEKQGTPDEIIKIVLFNIGVQHKADAIKQQKPLFYSGLLKVGLGVLTTGIMYLVYPNALIIPVGLLLSGIIYVIIARQNAK